MINALLILIIFLAVAGTVGGVIFYVRNLLMYHLREIKESQLGDSREMQKQIFSFTREATQIRENLRQVQERMRDVSSDVSSFQEIFKSPKLRGQWGEASLSHILSQYFPTELYKTQYLFSSGEQVDAVLKLPNGRFLPIDSKFPSENFRKMTKTDGENREFFQKKFMEDVKFRIREIAEKYILPSEGTVDFGLMYIPAEAIYYEIINNVGREVDLASFAWQRKVILTSPNTIYLILKTVEHWFKDTQISRETQEILKRLNRVSHDATKLVDDFRKLGNHLRNAVSCYDSSEKKLSMFSERVERLLETPHQSKFRAGEAEEKRN